MNHPCLSQGGWPILAALLLILLVPGCGDDDSTTPTPKPDVSMSLECNEGLIDLTVRNSGGGMKEPALFIAAFADGQSDTLLLSLGADDSTTCQLSNIHGGVTVSNDEWDLDATADDCLTDYFEDLATSISLGSFIPSPLAQVPVLLCTYTISLRNFRYDQPTAELIQTDDGLTLKYVYSNIAGDFSAPSPGALCVDVSGSIAISSIVIETRIDIGEGDDPEVTLGETVATAHGMHVSINGTFGPIVTWITNFFLDTFSGIIENATASVISTQVGGTDLSGLVIVNSSCAQ